MKLSQSWNFENDTFSNLDSLDNLKYIGEFTYQIDVPVFIRPPVFLVIFILKAEFSIPLVDIMN